MGHTRLIADDDQMLRIDPESRKIEGRETVVVQYDNNSERITFSIPRFVEGHDMSESNVSVHFDADGEAGSYDVDDVEPDADKVRFSWLIRRSVTEFAGRVRFLVKFRCYDGGNISYEWNTALCSLLKVVEGADNGGEIVEEYPDKLQEIVFRIEKLEQKEAASVDPTLSVEGLAADAKAVGEALAGKQPAGDYITEETDPTVPAWAKQPNPPTYTAAEVGADEKGSAAEALRESKSYTDQQIAAIPTPDVSGQIGAHNADAEAHPHIQAIIKELAERLNAVANSDDETLDQIAELVAYIKDNRTLIEQVTTGKVSVSDIVDNLATSASDKPLSAAQGVALKALIDAIVVPTNVSAFTNDAGYLTEHQNLDAYAKTADLSAVAKSGSYNDLTNKPTIPTVPTAVSAFTNDKGYLTAVPSEYATKSYIEDYVNSSILGGAW